MHSCQFFPQFFWIVTTQKLLQLIIIYTSSDLHAYYVITIIPIIFVICCFYQLLSLTNDQSFFTHNKKIILNFHKEKIPPMNSFALMTLWFSLFWCGNVHVHTNTSFFDYQNLNCTCFFRYMLGHVLILCNFIFFGAMFWLHNL
jgi:hypothetical protein